MFFINRRDTVKKISALVVSLLMSVVTIWYCYLIVTGGVRPVLATWMLFSLAVGIGIWSYLRSDSKKDVITNIANTADVGTTWTILIFILFFGRNTSYQFNSFEIVCIAAVIAILVYWRISKRANVANIAINGILAIAYLPLIKWLWTATENTESFAVWNIVFISSSTALYNPIKEKDWYALLYALRAVVSVGIVLFLMIRIQFLK